MIYIVILGAAGAAFALWCSYTARDQKASRATEQKALAGKRARFRRYKEDALPPARTKRAAQFGRR